MPNVNPPQASPYAPSILWDGTQFWWTYVADDSSQAIYWGTSANGANWTEGTINGQAASAGPAIALFKNQPAIIYAQVGSPQTILITTWDPQNRVWSVARVVSGDSAATVSAVGVSDGSLLIVFREETTSSIDYVSFSAADYDAAPVAPSPFEKSGLDRSLVTVG
jgi:hypothetical protein